MSSADQLNNMKITALSLFVLSSLASMAHAGLNQYLAPDFQDYLYEQSVIDELDQIRQDQEFYYYEIDRHLEELRDQG